MNTLNSRKTKSLVEVALFIAIVIILWLTPFIGYIPLGPVKATTIHIPVIIAGIVLGPKKGALIGFVFGITSFLSASFVSPNVSSFLFSPFYPGGNLLSLVICFLPRILIGVSSYYVYKGVKKLIKTDGAAIVLGAVAGSLTNTVLVMGMAYLFFGHQYAEIRNVAYEAVLGVILAVVGTNGVPEAIVASVITLAVCKALFSLRKTATA